MDFTRLEAWGYRNAATHEMKGGIARNASQSNVAMPANVSRTMLMYTQSETTRHLAQTATHMRGALRSLVAKAARWGWAMRQGSAMLLQNPVADCGNMRKLSTYVGMAALVIPLQALPAQSRDEFFVWGFDRLSIAGADTKDRQVVVDFIPSGTLKNIVNVSRSKKLLSVVAHLPTDSRSDELSLVILDVDTSKVKKSRRVPGLLRSALSPDGTLAALITCGATGCELVVLNLSNDSRQLVVKNEAAASALATWHPSGKQVAFDSLGGVTTVISLADGSRWQVEGSAPSWKPDGSVLALTQGRTIVLYDVSSRSYSTFQRRYFWQSAFVGPLSWRDDGLALLANASSGLTGYEYECLNLDGRTGDVKTAYSGPLVCGPWR